MHVLENPISNTAADTETNVTAFLEHGCRVIVSIGGDGTNRAIVRALEKARRNPQLADAAADNDAKADSSDRFPLPGDLRGSTFDKFATTRCT